MAIKAVVNTLEYDASRCVNCGRCTEVCPHGVFARGSEAAELVRPEACIECGACQQNCPTGAIEVDSGVGCAYAMIMAALKRSSDCGCGPKSSCCS